MSNTELIAFTFHYGWIKNAVYVNSRNFGPIQVGSVNTSEFLIFLVKTGCVFCHNALCFPFLRGLSYRQVFYRLSG